MGWFYFLNDFFGFYFDFRKSKGLASQTNYERTGRGRAHSTLFFPRSVSAVRISDLPLRSRTKAWKAGSPEMKNNKKWLLLREKYRPWQSNNSNYADKSIKVSPHCVHEKFQHDIFSSYYYHGFLQNVYLGRIFGQQQHQGFTRPWVYKTTNNIILSFVSYANCSTQKTEQ